MNKLLSMILSQLTEESVLLLQENWKGEFLCFVYEKLWVKHQ